jgi:hypothetical protein
MRIQDDGNVGIGTASPDGLMHLYYSNSTDVKTLIENNNADAIGLQIENTNGTGSAGASIHLKSSSADAYIVHEFTSSNIGKLHFHMDNKTSALVIDNDGKVGIGEDSPDDRLHVKEADSGQYILKLEHTHATEANGINILYTGTGGAYGTGDDYAIYFQDGDGAQFWCDGQGELWQGTGGATISSDRKLKDNIVDGTSKLEDINKLKVRNFNFKKYPDKKHLGFIAQEVQEIFPSLVKEYVTREARIDIDDDGLETAIEEKKSLGIQQAAFVPMLVKAVQELSAKVTALENA